MYAHASSVLVLVLAPAFASVSMTVASAFSIWNIDTKYEHIHIRLPMIKCIKLQCTHKVLFRQRVKQATIYAHHTHTHTRTYSTDACIQIFVQDLPGMRQAVAEWTPGKKIETNLYLSAPLPAPHSAEESPFTVHFFLLLTYYTRVHSLSLSRSLSFDSHLVDTQRTTIFCYERWNESLEFFAKMSSLLRPPLRAIIIRKKEDENVSLITLLYLYKSVKRRCVGGCECANMCISGWGAD